MVKTTICCDVCHKELPTYEHDTPFGKLNMVRTAKVRNWDLSSVLPHICESCAREIDIAILGFKLSVLEKKLDNI